MIVLALALGAPGALIFSWSRPMRLRAHELPPLVLDAEAAARCRAQHHWQAEHAPQDGLASERRALYLETNTAEAGGGESPEQADARRTRLLAALAALVRAHGQVVIANTRATDVARLEPALRGRIGSSERTAELGGFPGLLERYGAVAQERQLAPNLVLSVFFTARWNAIHDRPLTEGFCPIEQLAYDGWLALGARGAPIAQRMQALDAYAAAGGRGADEARAILLLEAEDAEGAAQAFERAYQHEPIFRLRNFALGARH